MNQKQLTLAYCAENVAEAEKIARQLQPAGYTFHHLANEKDSAEKPLFERLESFSGKAIVLITDNFLKSTGCMSGALRFFQNHAGRVLPVIADGVTTNETSGETEVAPTHFERVSDIIQYINYWQDRYLDVRRQKRHLEGVDEEGFNAHLRIMRDISSEVGEFLRLLRGSDFISLAELEHTHYERFFQFTGDREPFDFRVKPETAPVAPPVQLPDAPREILEPSVTEPPNETPAPSAEEVLEELISEPHIPVSKIPGIDLLPEITAEEARQVEEDLARVHEDVEIHVEFPQYEPAAAAVESMVAETGEPEPAVVPVPEAPTRSVEEIQAEVTRIVQVSSQLAAMGRKEDNLALLSQAIADYPEASELRYPYAIALAQNTDDIAEAFNQLEVLLEAQPGHVEGLFLMGELAEMRGDFSLAKSTYEKLIEISPQHAQAWFRLGAVCLSQYPGEETHAAACFEKAAQLDPRHVDAHYQYGLLAAEAGDAEQAEAAFRQALTLQPDHPFAWYDLALLYHRRGDAENAWIAYQNAVIQNPELKTPQNDMAFEYHRAARSAKAAEIIEKEQSALVEMRENLNRLEALLREREEELQQLMAKAAPVEQTVLITGATSGIGRATALLFAEHGYRLILTGRRAERLEALRQELASGFGIEVRTLVFDVRDAAAVQQAISSLEPEWASIDILINNAGKAKGLDPIHEGNLAHWEEMIDTNVKGLLYVTRAVAPQMVARRSGHIINIGSTAGRETYPKGNVYCASKFAVEALTRSMRLDLHMHNIRVSQVSPGHVEETEFALVRFDGDAERAKIYQDFKPLNSRDVAEAIYFMASRPAHVNIQDILMMGTQQASNIFIDRSGRND